MKRLSAKVLSVERYLGQHSYKEFGQHSETDFGPTHECVFCTNSETDFGKQSKTISNALLEQMISAKSMKLFRLNL